MMAIEMIGAVYCPLSPQDPQQRLHQLVEQIQSHLVLVHHVTKTHVSDNIVSLNVEKVLTDNDMQDPVNVDRMSRLLFKPTDVAYVIFTSGSTGIPKAVGLEFSHNSCLSVSSLHRYKFVTEISVNVFNR